MAVSWAPRLSLSNLPPFQNSSRACAARAAYVHLYIAAQLGYYISPTKSTLVPTQSMVHLGFGIDSVTSSYSIKEKFRSKFRKCREELLERGSASLLDMQRWVGKCNHLRLLFPGNSLFTIEARRFMSSAGEGRIKFPQAVRSELEFWSFVDSFTEPVPYLLQQHVTVRLCTDASGYGWGATIALPEGPTTLQDYWSSDLLSHDICSKEALAVLFALQSLESAISRRRVDVFVDNEGLAHAWAGLRSKSAELAGVLQSLFLLTIDLRISLKLHWISTHDNPADEPSRQLQRSDAMLVAPLRARLWAIYGPFSFDLMALPSNVLRDPSGKPLPFFSRAPSPSCSGVNVFSQSAPSGRLYVYPPFNMVTPVIRLFMEWGSVEVVMVLPTYESATPVWESLLRPFIQDALSLFPPSSRHVLRSPSSSGYVENLLPLPFGLSAFRCRFPPAFRPSPPLKAAPVRVLIVGDSVLRPLCSLSWPSPFCVLVRALSGASLLAVWKEASSFASSLCDVLVLHAGVNDASRGSDDSFEGQFSAACQTLAVGVASSFKGRKVLLSSVCQSRRSDLNVRVGIANKALRGVASARRWGLVSNDNVRFFDLLDDVHLNAGGVAKLHRNLILALKSL